MVLSCLRMKNIQYLLVLCAKSCKVLSRAPYCCCCLKHLPGLAALPKSRSSKSCASVVPLEDPEAKGTEQLCLQVTFGDSRDCSSFHNATASPTPIPNSSPSTIWICLQSSGSSPQCQEKDRSSATALVVESNAADFFCWAGSGREGEEVAAGAFLSENLFFSFSPSFDLPYLSELLSIRTFEQVEIFENSSESSNQ